MTKWDHYFKIVEAEKTDEDVYWENYEYQLVVITTGEVVGSYKDQKYAIKQAKYKFKKLASRVEKILLG